MANAVSQQQQAVNAFQQPLTQPIPQQLVQQPIYMDPNSVITPQPVTQTLPQIPISQPQNLATIAPEEALGQIRNVIQKVTRQNSIVQDPNLMVQNVQVTRQPSIDQVFHSTTKFFIKNIFIQTEFSISIFFSKICHEQNIFRKNQALMFRV